MREPKALRLKKQWQIHVEFPLKDRGQPDVTTFSGNVQMQIHSGALVISVGPAYDQKWLACYAAGRWVKASREEVS